MVKKLDYLLNQAKIKHTNIPAINITSISLDSRSIISGSMFCACNGSKQDGHSFIRDAIAKGAVAILEQADTNNITLDIIHGIVYIKTQDLSLYLGKIAAAFYDYPLTNMALIGITGTNGKTSVSHYITHALTALDNRAALIGTLGFGDLNNLASTSMTTPDVLTTFSILNGFAQQQTQFVSLEVSSHAIAQRRITELNFALGILTNISHDHLDYHGSMSDYIKVKKSFFTSGQVQAAVINIDDSVGKQLSCELNIKYLTYSLQSSSAHVYASAITNSPSGIQATIHTPRGKFKIISSLIGTFNLLNLLAATASLELMNIKSTDIADVIPKISAVTGRMQKISYPKSPTVIVDYAHTPDALYKALTAIKLHCRGRIWCVFGCGGNRDITKRSLMGKIAEQNADITLITSDNPRSENPQQIVDDILRDITDNTHVYQQLNRKKAFQQAITGADLNDWILIAGKGHETTQVFNDSTIEFNDAAVVTEMLQHFV